MNERIKELLEQANLLGDWGEDITEGRYFVYDNLKNLEKFAELIIKETLMVARVGMELGPNMAEAVYNYFGVEE